MTPTPPGDGQPSTVDTTLSFGLPEQADSARPGFTLSPLEQALIEALPEGVAILISHHGPGAGSRFLLDTDEVTVGRSESADIFLDDFTVSRKHAVFSKVGESGYRVKDVGSLNGTYLNRERIDETILRPGDEVQIGKFRLTFHANPNDPTSAA